MKILVFGTGEFYNQYKKYIIRHEILAFLDNDNTKQGRTLDGSVIVSPEELSSFEFDAIFLLSLKCDEMKDQLLTLGVDEKKIFPYYDILAGLEGKCSNQQLIIYGRNPFQRLQLSKKRILSITHNLNVTGAEIVLLEALKILNKRGYDIVLATSDDGPMRERFVCEGCSVIIDDNLRIARLENINWITNLEVNLIIVNTVFMWSLLRCYKFDIPVIWWLHDSEMLYKNNFCRDLNAFSTNKVHVYAVSQVAADPFFRRCNIYDVKLLPFGIRDINKKRLHRDGSDKIIFAIIGTVEKRKAQNVLLSAIAKLGSDLRVKCEFWFIYQNQHRTKFLEDIEEQAETMKEVKLLGYLDREEMLDAYGKISVVVCPSLSDTLPVVTIEAMQHSIPCIVSDKTGTASYIDDYINGLVCHANDAEDLADKISWMICHEDRLSKIGKAARRIYEEKFTLEVFEKNLLESLVAAHVE